MKATAIINHMFLTVNIGPPVAHRALQCTTMHNNPHKFPARNSMTKNLEHQDADKITLPLPAQSGSEVIRD